MAIVVLPFDDHHYKFTLPRPIGNMNQQFYNQLIKFSDDSRVIHQELYAHI